MFRSLQVARDSSSTSNPIKKTAVLGGFFVLLRYICVNLARPERTALTQVQISCADAFGSLLNGFIQLV